MMEYTESNKMIAEFMGLWVIQLPETRFSEDQVWAEDLKYHTSWYWLMPVVDKIRGMGYRVDISIGVDCSVHIRKIGQTTGPNIVAYSESLQAVYTAVVQFITWFNAQPK
jgi:hypothetical protein